ncbi:MAG: hypothetical protein ACI9YH_004103, partial [Colwellia sp.]
MYKLLLLLGFCYFTASATTINIKYSETEKDNKSGFYDRTARTPTEDNPGKTVGDARRYAFEYAAKIIESQVYSKADIIIEVYYSANIPYAADTIPNTYTHTETSNYDDYGILKDGVKYSELIKRMLQNDISEPVKNYNDAFMQFNYKGSNYDVNPVEGASSGFVHLALHELVHALGFGRMSCIGVCTEEQSNQTSQLSDNIYVIAPYDSKWDDMSLSDKNLAAVERNKIFYYGNQAMTDYLLNNLTTGINNSGIELHSEPLSDGSVSGQTLGHLSPNVTPVQLMASRVGNTLSLGASAYIICDIGWCRNDGFVTDFEMSSIENNRLTPDTLTFLKYDFSNANDNVLENVFIEFNVYDSSLISEDELDSKCNITNAIVSCDIGKMSSFESKSIELPFNAPIGIYRIMSNIYSNSHVVDLDGSNNVDVQIVKVGEVKFPEITLGSEFAFESEMVASITPTFRLDSNLTFNWSINTDSELTIDFQQNSQTGELTFTAPSVSESSKILFTLVATFNQRDESFDVVVTINPKTDNTGSDTGNGSTSSTENIKPTELKE